MGWIQYPTKATITAGLKAADPAAAGAAKVLADLMIAHLERLDDAEAVGGMVYSALRRAATESTPTHASGAKGKASNFDLLYLARVHGDTISDLAVAMVVFIAHNEESHPLKGADLEDRVRAAIRALAAPSPR